MKIVIPGGAGQLGGILARHFAAKGNEVVVLSRNQHASSSSPATGKNQANEIRNLFWDGRTSGPWSKEFEAADLILNLAGRSVNCRYNESNRQSIMKSRTESTSLVAETIKNCKSPPRTWMQMSTATIYAHRFDAENDEATGIIGGDEPNAPPSWRFSIEVAKAWEAEVDQADISPATRKLKLRCSIVMSTAPGSPFEILLRLCRFGLGGKNGDGKQYISWISQTDFIRAIEFLLENEELEGAVNLVAPGALPNEEFMRILRNSWGIPFGLDSPVLLLEMAAVFLQTETELILKSRRVAPGKLLKAGFQFSHPSWELASADLCQQAKNK